MFPTRRFTAGPNCVWLRISPLALLLALSGCSGGGAPSGSSGTEGSLVAASGGNSPTPPPPTISNLTYGPNPVPVGADGTVTENVSLNFTDSDGDL